MFTDEMKAEKSARAWAEFDGKRPPEKCKTHFFHILPNYSQNIMTMFNNKTENQVLSEKVMLSNLIVEVLKLFLTPYINSLGI